MSEARDDNRGYEKGARGFGRDRGLSPATTTAAAKALYRGVIMPVGKTSSNGGAPMPSGSAAGGSKGK